MAGPFTASVEVAGPFRIEGKPLTIAATQALAAAGQKPTKLRAAAAIIVIGIITLAAAALVIYKKKAAA